MKNTTAWILACKSNVCNNKYVGNVSDTMCLSIKLNVLPLNSLQISLNVFRLDHPDKPNGIKNSNVSWLKITPVLYNTAHNRHCFISNALLMAKRTKTSSNNLSFSGEKNKHETKIASINAQISS